jgi:predicted ATPase
VLVFEDLHWADEGLLDFVDYVAEWTGGVPILLVCSARPELLARRPGWGGGKRNATTISLTPLSENDIARLVASLLKKSVLPAETLDALLQGAGGNPLYAEEFARMLAERNGVDVALPETVQGLISGRLDTLAAEEKSLLQNAAVIGKVFWLGSVAHLGDCELSHGEQVLHALERKEFVRRERRSSVAGDSEYAFMHVLVRDVAYGQIPRASRAAKHRAAAAWIESLGGTEDTAEMLAHHYLSSLEFARATGDETGSLVESARTALRDAGDRASALSGFAAAARFYGASLELWPPDDPERAVLLFNHAKAS